MKAESENRHFRPAGQEPFLKNGGSAVSTPIWLAAEVVLWKKTVPSTTPRVAVQCELVTKPRTPTRVTLKPSVQKPTELWTCTPPGTGRIVSFSVSMGTSGSAA